MRGSHAPSLRTLVARTLGRWFASARPSGPVRILVATSGGPDSQALLHVLASLRDRWPLALRALGVDHGLRPEAGAELDFAAALADELGVPFARTKLTVRTGSNLQERARTERWAALRQAAGPGGLVATGHHLDDRAETVLFRLLRGAPLAGLGVMPLHAEDRIRPMIEARRVDVRRHLERHALRCASDPSNLDRRFARVRIRLDLMPLLEAENPRFARHLCEIADEAIASFGEERAPTTLPKATQSAILALVETARRRPSDAKKSRIALPGGLILRVETSSEET